MDMESLADLHPVIQLTVRRLSNPQVSLETLGEELGISKQAVHKKIQSGIDFLKTFGSLDNEGWVPSSVFGQAVREKEGLEQLVQTLRQQLVLGGMERLLLQFFRAQVLKFFPKFKSGRLPGREKKQILDFLAKFRKAGGLIKVFSKTAGVSAETLARWQEAYDQHGMNGLNNKSTRPKNFGNRVPLFIREALIREYSHDSKTEVDACAKIARGNRQDKKALVLCSRYRRLDDRLHLHSKNGLLQIAVAHDLRSSFSLFDPHWPLSQYIDRACD